MRFMTLSALAGSWLFLAPAMWAHRPEKAILGAAIGWLVMVLSPMGVGWAPARKGIVAGGLILGLSNFAFYDGLGILASDAVAGLCLLFAGLGPAPRATFVAAPALAAVAAPSVVDRNADLHVTPASIAA